MSIVTVWTNPSFHVQLTQLSDDPEDGTPSEQITYLGSLPHMSGWSCVDQNFTGSVPDSDPAYWRWSDGQVVAVEPVPASVTPRQVRLVLLAQGLLANVESLIAQQDDATKITWQYASEFRRDDPLLTALAQQLGLTSEQVDQFFIAASQL